MGGDSSSVSKSWEFIGSSGIFRRYTLTITRDEADVFLETRSGDLNRIALVSGKWSFEEHDACSNNLVTLQQCYLEYLSIILAL